MARNRMQRLEAEVEELKELVARMQSRLPPPASEPVPPSATALGSTRSRRDLLKLAGAAAVGAGGIMAVGSAPAAAASGQSMTLGQPNDANATTSLAYTAASAPAPLMKVVGSATSIDPATTQQGIHGPLFGLGASGNDGVDGYAAGATGYGLLGQSDAGYGVVGATDTGVDLAAIGTGRLQQRPVSTPGAGQPPGYMPAAGRFEIVRDADGLIWVSHPDGTWHRLSSLISFPDPRRVFNGFANPIPRNSTTAPIDATMKQAGGASGVPAGATAAYCAVQVLNHTVTGPLTLFPDGTADPGIANWVAMSTGTLNLDYMLVPLSAAGKFKIHSYIDGNVIVDAWGFTI